MHKTIFAILISSFAFVTSANGQTWNSNAGGWNTGYGTVYGSFGYAMATQNIYNSMQINMQQAMMRQAMINKWGRAAVEKAEREASAGRRSTASATEGPQVAPPPVVRNYGRFRPSAALTINRIADSLGESADERTLLKQIISSTKLAFENEVRSKGWKSNIAGALTFFLVSNAVIYNGNGEPSDEFTEVLFSAINRAIDETPDFGKMSDKQKQETYDTLIALSAIPLAVYSEGVQTNDADVIDASRQLAGKLIELVLKTSPERIRIDKGNITFGN